MTTPNQLAHFAINADDLDRAKERLYTGLSRPRDLLVVCGDPDHIRRVGGDEVLGQLAVEGEDVAEVADHRTDRRRHHVDLQRDRFRRRSRRFDRTHVSGRRRLTHGALPSPVQRSRTRTAGRHPGR